MDGDETVIGDGGAGAWRELPPGTMLDNYRIERLLGHGGMGAVYLAVHVKLDKRFALKLLPEGLSRDPRFRERFENEAKRMAALEHPGIVPVYNAGESQGLHYFAMEYLAGGDLELRTKKSEWGNADAGNLSGVVSPEAVREILRQVLEALAYAHGKGIIHRDLKPANLLLIGDPSDQSDPTDLTVKIADFGLAEVVGQDYMKSLVEKSVTASLLGSAETVVGSGGSATPNYAGTIHFMAPEVVAGEAATAQSDLYAVGVIGYYLLTGKKPVGRYKDASKVVAGLDPAWDDWLNDLMAGDPEDRTPTAEKALEALGPIGAGSAEGITTKVESHRGTGESTTDDTDSTDKESGGRPDESGTPTQAASQVAAASSRLSSPEPAVSAAPRKRRFMVLSLFLISLFTLLSFFLWPQYQQWQADQAAAEERAAAQAEADEETTRLRGEAEVALAAGDLAGAGRVLSELESRGAAAADLRARYEGLASAREARARAGEAEVLREDVAARYEVDGEGLRDAFQAMESTWRTAERATGDGAWGEALSGYDRVLREGHALLQLKSERESARETRAAVESLLPEVRRLVERTDEAEARRGLASAEAGLREGMSLYERGAFAEASAKFEEAGATLRQAQGRAEAVLAWRDGKNRWERALAAADRETLDSYGGDAWQRLRSVAASAERSVGDPAAGLRQYEEAIAGLPDVERGARAERLASALRAALGEARAAKGRSDWEAVLSAAERALGLDIRNAEALALKAEAEGNLLPRVRLVALVNGREVGATVRVGDRSERLPRVFELESGARFVGEVSYEAGGVRYRPERVELTADWRGVRERRVVLEEWRGPVRGQNYSVDLGGGVVMEFVWIAAINAWVGKYEVTNGEFRRFRSGHNSGNNFNGERQPVVQVSYDDAVAFTQWLSGRSGVGEHGVRARLLTGNEWTAIARCGTNREYPWGNSMPPTRGNYSNGISGYSSGAGRTVNVEQSGRNEWGLYGVGGNVWEWTSEQSGSSRVLRGASWYNFTPDYLRLEYRLTNPPSTRVGFRVVWSGGG